jgi:hypothetical protein
LYPFENIGGETVNIERFVGTALQLARVLFNSHHLRDAWKFIRYVLCGRMYSGDPTTPFQQLRLDVQSQAERINPDAISVSYDVDSLIGLITTLKMKPGHALSVYAVIDFNHTLTTDNHLLCTFRQENRDHVVPPHTVPNFCMAKIGTRGKLVVLLPALYCPGAPDRRVPNEFLKVWYNMIVRPSVEAIDFGRALSFPVSYQAAMVAQKAAADGRYHFSTFDIGGESVEALCHEIENRASHIAAFKGMFFLLEFRGTKGATRWVTPRDATSDDIYYARMHAVSNCIEPLDEEMLVDNAFWMDVAAEYFQPGKTLMMLKSGHSTVLQTIFPNMTAPEAARCSHRANFHIDTWAQTYQIAGFRHSMKPREETADAEYIQGYHTIKSFHYGVNHKNIWHCISARESLPPNISKLCSKLTTWGRTIKEAMDIPATGQETDRDHETGALDGAVRIEARVPFTKVDVVMTNRPTDNQMSTMFVAVSHYYIW